MALRLHDAIEVALICGFGRVERFDDLPRDFRLRFIGIRNRGDARTIDDAVREYGRMLIEMAGDDTPPAAP